MPLLIDFVVENSAPTLQGLFSFTELFTSFSMLALEHRLKAQIEYLRDFVLSDLVLEA